MKLGKNEAIISSELIKFRDYYYIIADITKNVDFNLACGTLKIHDNIALIIRDNEWFQKIGFTSEETNAIYCHELGHIFSKNQLSNNGKEGRETEKEIDSDTFAVEKCGINPEILESALKKTYEYEISHIKEKENMTQERLDRFVSEMRLRKRNIERLINDKSER